MKFDVYIQKLLKLKKELKNKPESNMPGFKYLVDMKILTLLLSISLFTACNIKKKQ